MSALLPVSERVYELNLCAEHGYTYREFKRSVRVYQSSDYKSALFLVYVTYRNRLPWRKTPYRNHFTLYRSADSVLVVRSETTLRFQDHDAALHYDVLTPTESYRATTACDWTVSFDKIDYSNRRPSFVTYSLVCSGEWWYFENGVVLNGVTAYEKDAACGNMFVYYELHPRYNIVTAGAQRNHRSGAQSRLLAAASSSSSLPAFLAGRTEPPAQTGAPPSTADASTAPPARGSNAFAATDVDGTSTTAAAAEGRVAAPGPNPRTRLCSFLADADSPAHVVGATTLNSSIAPIVNTLARPVIRANDTREAPDLDTRNVVPSMFWFVQRSREFDAKSIAYFLPKDFKLTPDFGSVSLLDSAYYNAGLPTVPLPQLDVDSPDGNVDAERA